MICEFKIYNMRLIILLCSVLFSLQIYAFDFTFKGVKFKCSAINRSSAKITSWPRSIKSVEIPRKVEDKNGEEYDVVAINVYSSGDNYMTEELIICEGVKEISKSCFMEFRKLQKVKLPTTLSVVGKNAFGNVRNYNVFEIPDETIKRILALSGISFAELPEPVHSTQNATPVKVSEPTHATIPTPAQTPAPARTSAHTQTVTRPKYETLVVEVISMEDKGNIAGNTKDYKHYDSHGDPCAMIRVSVAKYDLSYDSSDIPTPQESNIKYNDKGYDKIWMVEGARSLRIYSDKKEFEEKTIVFKNANKQIEKLESARVYDLKLRVVPLK